MLKALKNRGLNLLLASGTDEENVVIEANSLGYGEFFTGENPGFKRK